MKRDWDIMRNIMIVIESGFPGEYEDELEKACRDRSDRNISYSHRGFNHDSLSNEDIIKWCERRKIKYTIDDEFEEVSEWPDYQTHIDRFSHHVELLVDLGYIFYWRNCGLKHNEQPSNDRFHMLPFGMLKYSEGGCDGESVNAGLTNKGHDFLALYRNDDDWKAFKNKIASAGFKDGFPSYMVMPGFHR